MALPWKKILKALPAVVGTAEIAWSRVAAQPKQPPLDPHADLRTQVEALSARVQELEAAGAEQARLLAELAEHTEAFARRAARAEWVAWTGVVVALAAVIALFVR